MKVTAFEHSDVPATSDLTQLVRAGCFLFLSGQIGIRSDGQIVSDDPEEQMVQAFTNVDLLLGGVGASLRNVIKLTSYLTNEADKVALQRVRRGFFSPPYPASTLLVVKGLASPAYLYEVDVVATLDGVLTPGDSPGASVQRV